MLTRERPVRFLLVDDREENLVAIAGVLRRDGLELVMARSGREALEALLRYDFALAIIDVQMPEMDGLELAELMRGAERTQHVPIVLVTAGGREPARWFRGFEAGAVDFLYKPVEPLLLRNKAETFFQLYRHRQLLAEQLEQQTRAAEERQRLTRELEETLRLNELFVAVVGHDLRNPLAAILNATRVLTRTSQEPNTVRLAESVRHSAQRMQRMTSALFDLTRARLGGGIPLEPTTLDLRALAERTFEEQQLMAPGRQMRLSLQGDLVGCWDETRLAQLLANLLGNAIQHGQRDQIVELELADGADHVLIRVRNGGAIDETVRRSLFDPFSKRASGRSGDGLGLGLYIAQQVAFSHGGSIEVDSSEDRGTTFHVRLPREAAPAPQTLNA
jgi:two-component system, sensor histidine kinase and response regulator